MKEIKSYFDRYKSNYIKNKKAIKTLWNNAAKEEWLANLNKTLNESQIIYDENKDIISSLDYICENLNEKSAKTLYSELMTMYFEDYDDSHFLLRYGKKLIQFYEPLKDSEKLVDLYCVCQNSLYEIMSPEFYGEEYDYSYLKNGMAYVKEYANLSENGRYRIHILYYTYCIRYLDSEVITLKEALDCYEEFNAFLESDEIKKINEGVERISNIIEYSRSAFSVGVIKLDMADPETRDRYYNYVCSFFEDYFANVESLYEMSPEEFACYEFKLYHEKKITLEKVFDQYLDFFEYKYKIIENQTLVELDDIIQCINAIGIIFKLCNVIDIPHKVDKANALLTHFVEGRWISADFENMSMINDMLARVCGSLLFYDIPGINKDKCIKQLIIQRNINCYVKAYLVSEIAIAIYRELSISNITFFNKDNIIPKTQWKDYLYYASMFHDIGGCTETKSYRNFNRPPFEEELNFNQNNILAASKLVDKIPYLKKYSDVILGHHTYFDQSEGKNEYCDISISKYKPFLDIIALATYIEEKTNYYFDFEHEAVTFDFLLDELSNSDKCRFNPELVELITNSSRIKNALKKIVIKNRESVMYELFHNWEKIQLSEDEESILYEINENILIYRETLEEDKFSPYLSKVMYLAYNSKSERTRAYAMFYLMRYYFIKGDYSKGLGLETETNKLLSLIGNNELLIKNYINCANAEIIRENLEGSMSKNLMAVELAKVTPECSAELNLAIASIANIYAKVGNFAKANEYYEQASDEDLDDYEKTKLLCMQGYCYVKIGDIDNVKRVSKLLKHILIEHEEYNEYSEYVYLAYFDYNLGNTEDLKRTFDILRSMYIDLEEFKYSADEVILYMELLEDMGDISTLKDHLEYYINLLSGKKDFSTILISIITKRIRLATMESHSKEHIRLETLLYNSILLSSSERARHMEEMEKTFTENIKLLSEQEDYFNEKTALEQSVKRAKDESRQKSQFLSSMSHEIRTPINAILGLNEMILRECNEDGILQYATDINNAGKQLLGIVNDVLDYSKIEAGKMEIVPQKYNLGELVNDIKNMIEPKLSEKNLSYIVRCNSEIPNVLFGDDLRIKQILLNLLSNAYKYTNKGYVQFCIDYSKIDDKTIALHFEIKDSGVGMTKSQIDKLSLPFERFNNPNTRGAEGTGLGMSIVTKLLEQMDSKLEVSSVYGEGSVFSFDLRQGVVEWGRLGKLDDVKKKVMRQSMEKKKQTTGTVVAPEAKILVVDDNAVNLKVIQALLKRNKVQVTTACSGKECLDLCRTNAYNIIFLDHMMPEMDGLETLSKLKKMGGINLKTPVIALTANVTESGEDFYGKAGFDTLLTKPVDFDKLEETLRKYLPSYLITE